MKTEQEVKERIAIMEEMTDKTSETKNGHDCDSYDCKYAKITNSVGKAEDIGEMGENPSSDASLRKDFNPSLSSAPEPEPCKHDFEEKIHRHECWVECTHCGLRLDDLGNVKTLIEEIRQQTSKEVLEHIEGQGRISHHLVLERIELTTDEWKAIKQKYGVGA